MAPPVMPMFQAPVRQEKKKVTPQQLKNVLKMDPNLRMVTQPKIVDPDAKSQLLGKFGNFLKNSHCPCTAYLKKKKS